ncbi:hypothetical protein [Bacteroides sp. An322]|nr:hypothetical protein [Bacteroides sp. An322]
MRQPLVVFLFACGIRLECPHYVPCFHADPSRMKPEFHPYEIHDAA